MCPLRARRGPEVEFLSDSIYGKQIPNKDHFSPEQGNMLEQQGVKIYKESQSHNSLEVGMSFADFRRYDAINKRPALNMPHPKEMYHMTGQHYDGPLKSKTQNTPGSNSSTQLLAVEGFKLELSSLVRLSSVLVAVDGAELGELVVVLTKVLVAVLAIISIVS